MRTPGGFDLVLNGCFWAEAGIKRLCLTRVRSWGDDFADSLPRQVFCIVLRAVFASGANLFPVILCFAGCRQMGKWYRASLCGCHQMARGSEAGHRGPQIPTLVARLNNTALRSYTLINHPQHKCAEWPGRDGQVSHHADEDCESSVQNLDSFFFPKTLYF